jgi:PTH2 family peptidyl-tRNA hydrolase
MRKSKQVIIVRKDLRNTKGEKIRTGKIVSQGCHSAVKAIFDQFSSTPNFKYITSKGKEGEIIMTLHIPGESALNSWLTDDMFTKITVAVNSEAELLEVYNKAKEKGLPCSLITDAGLTEFGGVPTLTTACIGPAWDDEVDEITKKLQLL